MNKKLLILGAGNCGMSAMEIAKSTGCFEKISFLDDNSKVSPDGSEVLDCIVNFKKYAAEYSNIFVALGNAEVKLNLLQEIEATNSYRIVTLISPNAYISPTAQVMQGSIVEPMAVVNTCSVIGRGCIIGAGSVVNHCSMCGDGVHLECNATVADNAVVPAGTFVDSGEIFKRDIVGTDDVIINSSKLNNGDKPHCHIPIDGKEYSLENDM